MNEGGPGYATRHLHDSGIDAFGIDLSSALVEIARQEHPGVRFEVGTMTDLDLETGSLAGVAGLRLMEPRSAVRVRRPRRSRARNAPGWKHRGGRAWGRG